MKPAPFLLATLAVAAWFILFGCTVTEPVKPTCTYQGSDGKVYVCGTDSLANNNAAVGRGGR